MSELKPCPFCGGKPNIYYESDGVGYVNCANEFGSKDYSCTGTSLNSTIDEWNARPAEAALAASRDAWKAIAEDLLPLVDMSNCCNYRALGFDGHHADCPVARLETMKREEK